MNTKKIIFLFSKLFLGLPLLFFGLNKFLGFAQMAPPDGQAAQAFLGAMFTTYLFKLVALTEITGGVLLFIPKTSFIGALLLLPVVTNIVAFHLAHDLPGNGIWIFTALMQMMVLYFFKEKFNDLLLVTK